MVWHSVITPALCCVLFSPNLVANAPAATSAQTAQETSQDWLDALGQRETGFPIGNPQQYQARDSLNFVGKYMFGESILKELGYYLPPLDQYGVPYYYQGNPNQEPYKNLWQGTWTGKAGIDSLEEFINSPSAQEQAIREAMRLYWKRITEILAHNGSSIDFHLGKDTAELSLSDRQIRVTRSGLLAGAHLRGAQAIVDWLLRGQENPDERGTSIVDYVDEFGGYNLEDVDFLQ
jgi:hypothetical protein